MLSSGKEMLVQVTWTQRAAVAAGVAVACDDDGAASNTLTPKPLTARTRPVMLHKRRGSRSLVTGAGTAGGVNWDTAEAMYTSGLPLE